MRRTLDRLKRRTRQRLRGEVNVDRLVAEGLELGRGAYIGRGVFIDAGHPWLISVGEDSVLTAGTVVLAHDGSARRHTGCSRTGRAPSGPRRRSPALSGGA